MEVTAERGRFEARQILPRGGEEFPCLVEGQPALDGDARILRSTQAEILLAPAGEGLEWIAGRRRLVNDEGGRGSPRGGDLELVGPAAIVGHGPPLEELLVEFGRVLCVGDLRIVDQHDDGLAANVDPLEIVPAIFGSDDSVANEDNVSVLDLDRRLEAGGAGEVVLRGERHLPGADGEGSLGRRGVADEGHLLDPRAIRIARLQSEGLEAIDEVADGQLLAASPGSASFIFVRGQDADVVEERLSREAGEGRLQFGRGHRRLGWGR